MRAVGGPAAGGLGGRFSSVRIVLATGNPGKVREYERILASVHVEVVGVSTTLPSYQAPPEDGLTFADNALIKARHAAAATGLPALADDSGLCVRALGGAPGVRSARFGGPALDDVGRCDALLRALEEAGAHGPAARAAWFECAIAAALPGGEADTVSGRCHGRILDAPRGNAGFGYDPLFVPSGEAMAFAEMTAEGKDAISHRGVAARGLAELLGRVVGGLAGADAVV